ncbi:MAG: hypothetical protein OM95_11315 [Bdellovibrio sp. ArHS]|uniref:4'-phosphopantetheinyl transferase superfamily protein n=1 Tax=Bdellovibrio sp. ArHS TaxID=1569284 RepID=UPI000583A9F1|nr:4'-phosphopantetheinyl transferase superfamily protein [Bdellovibrio sp. ArHS]KHD88095.1 MAG: hypothetical protein OM95_11315 [Bdellovibrio sp. ArHS]
MTLSQSVIESLKKHLPCPQLEVLMASAWGSQNASHRTLIRDELAKILNGRDLYTSVSHCTDVGIAVIAPAPIGIDVEIKDRVTAPVMARVSRPEEMQAAPSLSSLWCAKEAAFKALRPYDQPSVLSKISIGDWQNIDSQFETYRLLNASEFNSPSENRGVTIHSSAHTFSFFIFYT